QTIKIEVESHVLFNLLSHAKQLNDLFYTDARLSSEDFERIETTSSHFQSNRFIKDAIELITFYVEKYVSSSVVLRCYIHLHVPSSESGNNQGVNIQLQILKEIQEMETIVETNESLIIDYYKKHYELAKYLNKYPSIEDYHSYLIEYERKMFDDLRSIILELRTIFLKTYEKKIKNLAKIQMPRNEQNISMID
ncbi:Proteasome activator complex subunit 3, partial [Dictyocoela muelleri]